MRRMTIAILCAATFGFAAPVMAASTMRWGPYTVRATASGNNRIVDIVDGAGSVVRSVRGEYQWAMKTLTLAANGPKILVVSVSDGGNSGLDMIYLYTYDKTGVHNIGYVYDVIDDIAAVETGPDSGPAIAVHDLGSLHEFDHFSRGGCGPVYRVYNFDGTKCVDDTARASFHWSSHFHERKLLRNMPAAARYVRSRWVDGHDDSMALSHEDVMAPLIEYWANLRVMGRGDRAKAFFQRHCSRKLYAWIMARDKPLHQALVTLTGTIPISDAKIVGLTQP